MFWEMGSKIPIGALWWWYEVCDKDGLLDAQRIEWENAKMSKLEDCIANINPNGGANEGKHVMNTSDCVYAISMSMT